MTQNKENTRAREDVWHPIECHKDNSIVHLMSGRQPSGLNNHEESSGATTSKTPTFGAHNLMEGEVLDGNDHSPDGGVMPVVTTSSTAEEDSPVRETYWTGGSSIR